MAAAVALAVRERPGGGDWHRGGAEGEGPGPRSACSARAGTEERLTSGSPACRGCSSETTTLAHEIPYVATATIADLRDLEAKVERAMGMRGARYLHVLVTCPLGWGAAASDSVRIARLAVQSGSSPSSGSRRPQPPTLRTALMDKPFAITLEIGSSLANKTGSWRTERPLYVRNTAPCAGG